MSKKIEDLKHEADQVLQGIRIVLPGTQALMGFQFISIFEPSIQDLPDYLKMMHFVALLMTILCTILLISPVAFQQIGEDGNATSRFLRFSRIMLTSAMVFLLVALTLDGYLAAKVIGLDNMDAGLIAAVIFNAGLLFWFLLTYLNRKGG